MLVDQRAGSEMTMGKLLLGSLEIHNFRGFHNLHIEHLGRVNLIVGKNNVGKTSLLEALRLYAERGSPVLILELLGARDEVPTLPYRNPRTYSYRELPD